MSASRRDRWRRAQAAPVARADYIDHLLARLRAAGVRQAIVAPLVADDPDFAVAKMLVPDLENLPGDRRFRYGKRMLRAMTGRA